MLRGELLLRGLSFPPDSTEEVLAGIALERRRDAQYLATVAIINAIMHVGQVVAGGTGGDAIKKSLDELVKVLFPGEADKLAKRADEVKALVQREVAKGPLKIMPVDDGGKKAAKRRRSKR